MDPRYLEWDKNLDLSLLSLLDEDLDFPWEQNSEQNSGYIDLDEVDVPWEQDDDDLDF